MQNNTLNDFTSYIQSLCESHVDIRHSDAEKHFIEINAEQQLSGKYLHLPVVALDKLDINYSGQTDAFRKDRYVELLFLDKCSDPANYQKIKDIKDRMESICEDFINKIREDKRLKKLDFLKNLIISDIRVYQIENKNMNMYGAMMAFNFNLPYSALLTPGRFV